MAPLGPANPAIGLLDDVKLNLLCLLRAISDEAELALSFSFFRCASAVALRFCVPLPVQAPSIRPVNGTFKKVYSDEVSLSSVAWPLRI